MCERKKKDGRAKFLRRRRIRKKLKEESSKKEKYQQGIMSSILRTIDALRELHVGYFVEFQQGRVGYVEEIIPPDIVRIVEDDGMTESRRPRRFNVKKNKVALSPKSGNTFTNNRNLIQPHEPYDNKVNEYSD